MSANIHKSLIAAQKWLTELSISGPNLITNAHRKLVHEAIELESDLSLDECADVFICLAGIALSQGWNTTVLANAINKKVEINRERTWTQESDGTWQHDIKKV